MFRFDKSISSFNFQIHAMFVFFVLLLLPFSAFADATYDREINAVMIDKIGLGIHGSIRITNKEHIIVEAVKIKDDGKFIALCDNKPMLGMLLLEGREQIGRSKPKVTDVLRFPDDKDSGYVRGYVFKGDDALDLLDLLLEYRRVGFTVFSSGCPDSGRMISGNVFVEFETRGLERALSRIK